MKNLSDLVSHTLGLLLELGIVLIIVTVIVGGIIRNVKKNARSVKNAGKDVIDLFKSEEKPRAYTYNYDHYDPLEPSFKEPGEPKESEPTFNLESFRAKNTLTQTELKLYHILRLALPEFYILAQVQMSSFINVYTEDIEDKWNHLNKIIKKSVDYLVIDKTGNTIAAIELQDKSHERQDRKESDKLKKIILAQVEIPLVEFHANSLPDIDEVKKRFGYINKTAHLEK
jgi:competence protein ComGC